MGKEIESKILLTQEEYERITEDLKKRSYEAAEKSDEYYSMYGSIERGRAHGEPLIRVRSEIDPLAYTDASHRFHIEHTYFTIKKKVVKNGVEYNEENETLVGNPSVIRDFLLATGYKKVYEKRKDAIGAVYTMDGLPFHIEVEKLNGKVYAAEIECTLDEDPEKVRIALAKVFTQALGIKDPESRYEHRSWMEILK